VSAVVLSLLVGTRLPRANRINGWPVPNKLISRDKIVSETGQKPGEKIKQLPKIKDGKIQDRSVAIVRETRNGVRPISGAQNEATAMAFGGPRSSCVRPGAHSRGARTPAMTGRRIAWPSLSSPPALTRRTPTKRSALRLRRGRRTPLVAYAPSLSYAPPKNVEIKTYPSIEHGEINKVAAIVLHRTDSPNVNSTIQAYAKGKKIRHSFSHR